MASPAFGAIGTLTNISNTTSIPRPTVASGDAMLLPVVLAYGDASVATPSGWTLVDSVDQNSAFEPAIYLFGKIAGGSEPSTYSVTISGQGGGNNLGYGVILTYTGALSSGTFEAVAHQRNTSASTSATIPGLTASSANTTQVAFYIPANSNSTSRSWTPPSGMTERLDLGQTPTGYVLGIADIAVASAGAISSRTATLDASHTSNTLTVLIASEAAAGDTTPPTLTGTITVGTVTSSSIQISWPSGSDNVAVTSYETSPDGSTWTDRGNVLTYTFTGLTASTSYTLRVRAKDAAGNVSTPALSVTQSTTGTGPTINTQPSGQTVTAPATATFTVAATASAGSLTYQWQRQPSGGGGYVNVSSGSGGTTASYTTGSTTVSGGSHNNGDTYRCNVTDSNGTTTSSAATLTVNAALAGLTSSPLKDNTGALHLSAPFEAFVLNASTGALVVRKTGLTSHASTGVVTFTDAALTAATQYRVVWHQTATGAQGVELLTAA